MEIVGGSYHDWSRTGRLPDALFISNAASDEPAPAHGFEKWKALRAARQDALGNYTQRAVTIDQPRDRLVAQTREGQSIMQVVRRHVQL